MKLSSEQYGVGFAKGNDAVKDQFRRRWKRWRQTEHLQRFLQNGLDEDITTIGK